MHYHSCFSKPGLPGFHFGFFSSRSVNRIDWKAEIYPFGNSFFVGGKWNDQFGLISGNANDWKSLSRFVDR